MKVTYEITSAVSKIIFKRIAHGDTKHREWLEDNLTGAVQEALESLCITDWIAHNGSRNCPSELKKGTYLRQIKLRMVSTARALFNL